MRFRFAVVLLCLALPVAACNGSSSTAHRESPSARAGSGGTRPPAVQPLTLNGKSLWDSQKAEMSLEDAELREGSAVLLGRSDEHTELTVVNATTGKARWSLTDGDALRGGEGRTWSPDPKETELQIVGDGDGWGVLVTWFAIRRSGGRAIETTGMALLSGEDGKVRWKYSAARSDRPDRAHGRLVHTDGKVALAVTEPVGPPRPADVTTVAIDAGSGRELWSRAGIEPKVVAGDAVLGRVRPPGSEHYDDVRGSLVGLDAATGRPRWDSTALLPGMDLTVQVSGGRVAVISQRTPDGSVVRLVRDLGTGRELANLPASTDGCETDGEKLIACHAQDGERRKLITIIADDGKVNWSERDIGHRRIVAVRKGRVFLGTESRPAKTISEVDRAGDGSDLDLPGKPIALSDRFAIFVSGESSDEFSLYRIA